jgi:anti-anti-sigma factor
MMLGVTIHDLGETAIVRCVGRIGMGETETLRKAGLSLSSRRTVVLDLARVDAIDGAGIGVLVFLHEWARVLGIDLQLMNPTPHVRELLELTNLDSVFKILLSEDTAWSPRTAVPAIDDTAAYQRD